MKNTILFFIKVVTAGLIAVAILSIVNLMYHYTGVHIENDTGATDYVWESKQIRTNMKEGFAWLQLDKNGFNNTAENAEKALVEGVDILLMGSSHMEAMQVAADKNVGTLLNRKLPEMNTYNIGMSGHDIYRIFDNVENAVSVYQPTKYLIMEIDEIKLDIDEMQDVVNGTANKIPSYDSGIVYQMQKIPAVKWIYKSLDDWLEQSKSSVGNVFYVFAEENEVISIEEYEQVLGQFLNLCVEACKQKGCTPIIFYHQQAVVQSDGSMGFDTEKLYLDMFANVCKQKGIMFVDMCPVFMDEYENNQILPHGFINSYVGSGHINAEGHRMIANKITDMILELEAAKNGAK